MAGRVRHPIDVKALERYIEQHVPEIKTPLDIKQVGMLRSRLQPNSLLLFLFPPLPYYW